MHVFYRQLANDLQALTLSSTVADLRDVIKASEAVDPMFRDSLLAGLADMPPGTDWITGLVRLCCVLQEDNARFQPAIFMDAATEAI